VTSGEYVTSVRDCYLSLALSVSAAVLMLKSVRVIVTVVRWCDVGLIVKG